MPDYSKGKIYKLIDNRTREILYVGSTVQTLSKRLGKHSSDCKSGRNGMKIYQKINQIGGFEHVGIVLIRNAPCESREELLREECKEINNIGFGNLSNSVRPARTEEEKKEQGKKCWKEWKDENPERIKVIRKKYYEKVKQSQEFKDKARQQHIDYYKNNQEKIKQKRQEKYTCEACKTEITRRSKARHEKTAKHLENSKK